MATVTTAVLCVLTGLAAIQEGDNVVTVSETRLMVGHEELATIPAGTSLVATEVQGDWVAVTVRRHGKDVSGWIAAEHLERVAEPSGSRQVTIVPLGKIPRTIEWPSLTISPDGRRVAYSAIVDGGIAAFVDGVRDGLVFGGIDGPIFSPDSRRMAYVAQRALKYSVVVDGKQGKEYPNVLNSTLKFSPDGNRFGYVATDAPHDTLNANAIVVIDGVEAKTNRSATPFSSVDQHDTVVFSPRGDHVAYVIQEQPYGGETTVVLDGKKVTDPSRYSVTVGQPPRLGSFGHLTFSPDGKRLAFAAQEATAEGHWKVVVGMHTGRDYSEIMRYSTEKPLQYLPDARDPHRLYTKSSITFSPDSQRVAYVAARGEKQLVVVDGAEGKEYESIDAKSLAFGPKGKHFVYLAKRNVDNMYRYREIVVINGKEGKEYQRLDVGAVGRIVISPNDDRVAYIGNTGRGHVVVVDNEESKPYSFFKGLCFSPDGKHVAYAAELPQSGRAACIVVDGIEQTAYEEVGTPVFSPDSKRIVHWAKCDGKLVIVLDGKEGKPYEETWLNPASAFSPDSKHAVYAARRGNKWMFVVDGREHVLPVDRLLPGSRLMFAGGTSTLHVLAQRGDEFVRLEMPVGEAVD